MNNNISNLWDRIFEQTERLADKNLTDEKLKQELAVMEGLYKASKSVIDMTNAVTKMYVMEKTHGITLPSVFRAIEENPVLKQPCLTDAPIEPLPGRKPLLSKDRAKP